MDYVTTNWIEGKWSLAMWNYFGNDSTNIHIDGWHHKFNTVVKETHPHMYEAIRILKQEQSITGIKENQLVRQ